MNGTIRPVEALSETRRDEVLRVGVDLGTSRSAICASNGRRVVVDSFVGWPVDSLARRLLGEDLTIGAKAIENRSMLDLHRPLEQGLIKRGSARDAEAVREIVKALLAAVGAGEWAGVQAVVGVPAEALRVNRRDLRSALTGVVDQVMIVSEPFAVAYGVESLLHALIIDIGAGTTDLCLMQGRYPTERDQKTLTVAGDSIDEHLLRLVSARYPQAALSTHMIRRWKEAHGYVGEPREVFVEAPVEGRPTKLDIGGEMRTACVAILPPVIETLFELLGRVEADFQERVRHNIILAGGSSLIGELGVEIQKALGTVGGGNVKLVKDPFYAGAEGGLAIAVDASDDDWERLPIAASAWDSSGEQTSSA